MNKSEIKVKLDLVLPWKSKTNSTNFKKYKLKKKWRFWRLFKRFFLGKKKRNFLFHKLKWMFNQKRIMWHQLVEFYGKPIKNLIYTKNQTKVIFGTKFFNVISFLELRLNILLLRIHFASKLSEANSLIKTGLVQVNGNKCHSNCVISVGDFITKKRTISMDKLNFRSYPLKWRWWNWRKWKWIMRSLSRPIPKSFFSKAKSGLCVNYMEINHKINTGVLLRRPFWGEILVNKQRKMLTVNLLKKVYFLY